MAGTGIATGGEVTTPPENAVVFQARLLAIAYDEAMKVLLAGNHDPGTAHFAALKAMELAERTTYGA